MTQGSVTVQDTLDRLRSKITSGKYMPDGKVGTYISLKAELGVPEKKLKAAIAVLQAEAVLIVQKGRGGIFLANRPDVRFCPIGDHYASLDNFGPTKKSYKNPEGRQAYCIPCSQLNSQLRFHHMTAEEYSRRLKEQDGKCPICDEYMPRPEIDHDHDCCPNGQSCGKCTRSLLCKDCSRTIGWSRDNAGRLLAAAAYVLRHKEVVSSAVASE